MRLDEQYREHLKKAIQMLRPQADIYLYGSRTDDSKRGGDIDLLIICEPILTLQEHSQLLMGFWQEFGEQKVDIACYSPSSNLPFKKLALSQAIAL